MKFEINDTVKIINGCYVGRIGTVVKIYPAGTMSNNAVVTIKYENSNNKGMFEVQDLMLMS